MDEHATEQSQIVPFDGIGLCFSGGGYRATFFALGVVAYLHRIQYAGSSLLSRNIAISSVSGGTLLSVAYAKAAQSSDFNFNVFYKTFYNQFTPENDKLLERAVAKLEDKHVWNTFPYKKRSLINAFALTYAEMDVFEGGFDVFENNTSVTLANVCFNSTEFSFGLPFRFQNTGLFGNFPLNDSIPRGKKELNKMKFKVQLGDIVASSSCFPLGFEPLIFPDDYFSDHTATEYQELKKEAYYQEGIGVMDGGIADNQGIDSMINITKRERVKDHFNLLIVNDVASYKMVPWVQDTEPITHKKPLEKVLQNFLKYFGVNPLFIITLVLGILLIFLNWKKVIWNTELTSVYLVGGILTGAGLVLTVLGSFVATFKKKGQEWSRDIIKKNVPEALLNDVISFQRLDVGLLKRMLTDRLTSGAKMINDVFLKQIRRLNYDMMYNEETLENKRITSTVYQLNGEKTQYGNNKFNDKIHPKPSTELTHTSLIASQAPTTLWWDQKDIEVHRMDSLIACGQFTTCYNLLDYVLDLKSNGYSSSELDALEAALREDWKTLNDSPLIWVKPE